MPVARTAATLLCVIVVGALRPDPAASGPVTPGGYSFGDGSTRRPIDPIGLLFVGRRATVSGVQDSLRATMRWSVTGDETDQWFHTGARWERMGGEQASGCAICTRDHLRLGTLDLGAPDAAHRATVATPHHDQKSRAPTCRFPYGHVARAFNGTRDAIVARYRAAGVRVTSAAWGNVALVKQCDGSWVGSRDGVVAVVMLDEREPAQARPRARTSASCETSAT